MRRVLHIVLASASFAAACGGTESVSPPSVVRFAAADAVVASGGTTELRWEVERATSVSIAAVPGGASVVSNSRELSGAAFTPPLTSATTFVLTAVGEGGSATAEARVSIASGGTRAIDRFTAGATLIDLGEAATLSWAASGEDAEYVEILAGIGPAVVSRGALIGQVEVTPRQTTAYTLAVHGGGGVTVSPVLTIVVNDRPPMIAGFGATPGTVDPGAESALAWRVTLADTVRVLDPTGAAIATSTRASGEVRVRPRATSTYRLEAVNGVGRAELSATVFVRAPAAARIVDFTADPVRIRAGMSSLLRWAVADAPMGVTITSGRRTVLTSMAASGMMTVTPTITAEYVLTARSPNGNDVRRISVEVTPADPARVGRFTATPMTLRQGARTRLEWAVTGAPGGVEILEGARSVFTSTAASGATERSPAATTVYTLVARSPAGNDVAMVTVTVEATSTMEVEPNDAPASATAIAGSGAPVRGAIGSATDADWYSVLVPGGGSVFAELQDGSGGCTLRGALRLHTAGAADLLAADEPSSGCARIDPAAAPRASQLAAGVYLVEVRGAAGPYQLVVRATGPACGNRIRERGEQCDDGDTTPGDGCDAACGVETAGTLPPGIGSRSFPGTLAIGARVYYRVELASDGYVSAETFAPTDGRCDAPADTVLELLDAGFALLGRADGGGLGACARFRGGADAFASVPAGVYWVVVREAGDDAAIAAFSVAVRTASRGCGNGILEGAEQCDDGNAMAGDGCNATCNLEITAEDEAGGNDTPLGAGVRTAARDTLFSGAISPASDVDFYAVTVPAAGHVTAFLTQGSSTMCFGPARGALALFAPDRTTLLAADDASGPGGGCGRIAPDLTRAAADLSAGTYYLRVTADAALAGYLLHVDAGAGACGDGIVETSLGESCDDGNTAAGDGCDASCRSEAAGTVRLPSAMQAGLQGAIATLGGAALFRLEVTAEVLLEAEVFVPDRGAGCVGADTVLELLDGSMRVLGASDRSSGDGCSRIDGAMAFARLAAGTYFLRVRENGNDARVPAFTLEVAGRAANTCGNGAIEGAEQCDDGNGTAADGCDAQCRLEIAPATVRPPGATVSLDLSRPGAFATARLELAGGGYGLTARAADPGGTTCDVAGTDLALLDASFRVVGTKLDGGPRGSAGACAAIAAGDRFAQDLPAGTYYLRVTNAIPRGGVIALEVALAAPMCGNGRLERAAGERCDDGGTAAGDGCGASCQYEGTAPLLEREPDDTQATATATGLSGTGTITVEGSIWPNGDDDVWSVVVPAGQTRALSVRTHDRHASPMSCTPFTTAADTLVTVEREGGAAVASNDDADAGAGVYCSALAGVALTAVSNSDTRFYVRVQGRGDAAPAEYFMTLDLR